MARKELRCSQEECSLPVAYLENGALIIESRHHGEKHETIFSIAALLALAYCEGLGKVTLSAEPSGNHQDSSLFR